MAERFALVSGATPLSGRGRASTDVLTVNSAPISARAYEAIKAGYSLPADRVARAWFDWAEKKRIFTPCYRCNRHYFP
jgi:hypothetical protein